MFKDLHITEEDIKEIIRNAIGAYHILYQWLPGYHQTISLHLLVLYDKENEIYIGICLDNMHTHIISKSDLSTAEVVKLLCKDTIDFFEEQFKSIEAAAENGETNIADLTIQAHPLLWAEYHRIEHQAVIGLPFIDIEDKKVFDTFRFTNESSEQTKMKPCPFCGSKNLKEKALDIEDREGIPMTIICNDCGSHGPVEYMRDPVSLDSVSIKICWDARNDTPYGCPFCGNEDIEIVTTENDNDAFTCSECGATGPSGECALIAQKLWETRLCNND